MQKAISQIYGKKCLVGVVVSVQPPASHNTELDTENAGRNIIMCSPLCFSHSSLEIAGLEWAGIYSHPDSYKHKTCTALTHPRRLLSSTLPPVCPSGGDSSSSYSATTTACLLVPGLKCQEQLFGLTRDPLTSCLWQWAH